MVGLTLIALTLILSITFILYVIITNNLIKPSWEIEYELKKIKDRLEQLELDMKILQ